MGGEMLAGPLQLRKQKLKIVRIIVLKILLLCWRQWVEVQGAIPR